LSGWAREAGRPYTAGESGGPEGGPPGPRFVPAGAVCAGGKTHAETGSDPAISKPIGDRRRPVIHWCHAKYPGLAPDGGAVSH